MAYVYINNAQSLSRPSLYVSAKSDESTPLLRPSSGSDTTPRSRSENRESGSCSPPWTSKPSARRFVDDDFAILKCYGEGGKWLYTAHRFRNGVTLLVDGERPEVMSKMMQVRQRVETAGGRGSGTVGSAVSSNSSSLLASGEGVDSSWASRRNSKDSRAEGEGSVSIDLQRSDSGLSVATESDKPETSAPSVESGKVSHEPSLPAARIPCHTHSMTYGTSVTDLVSSPARRPSSSMDLSLRVICAQIPCHRMGIVIACLVFLIMFMMTIFLQRDKYGCYWSCDGLTFCSDSPKRVGGA